MPRLSRKKRRGSKIIEKKNTKKRTKKITTKKNLKGGGGVRDKFMGSQKTNNHSVVNTNRRKIDDLIRSNSKEIIALINYGCLPEHSEENNNNDPWQTCTHDAVKKIKETFEPIIKKLKKEIEDENEKKLVIVRNKELLNESNTNKNFDNLDMGMFKGSTHSTTNELYGFEGFGTNDTYNNNNA